MLLRFVIIIKIHNYIKISSKLNQFIYLLGISLFLTCSLIFISGFLRNIILRHIVCVSIRVVILLLLIICIFNFLAFSYCILLRLFVVLSFLFFFCIVVVSLILIRNVP